MTCTVVKYRALCVWTLCDIHCYVTQLECCGASGPHDYQTSTWFNLTRHSDGLFVPQSCCVMRDTAASRPVPLQQRICQHDALLYRPDQPLDSEFLHTRVTMTTRSCQQNMIYISL